MDSTTTDIPTLINEALRLESQGQLEGAVTLFESLVQHTAGISGLNEKLVQLHCQLFQKQLGEGKIDQAVTSAKRAAHYNPQVLNAKFFLDISAVYENAGRLNDALSQAWNAIEKERHLEDAYSRVIHLALSQGELTQALYAYDLLLKQIPGSREISNRQHVSLAIPWRRWRLQETLHGLNDSLIAVPPESIESSGDLTREFLLGVQAVRTGSLCKARDIFSKLSQDTQPIPEAVYNLSLILSSWGVLAHNPVYTQEAINRLHSLTQTSAHWAKPFHELGKLIFTSSSNAQLAFALQQRALELDPLSEEANFEASEMSARCKGVSAESEAYIKRYLELKTERQAQHPIGKLGLRFLNWINTYAFGHLALLPKIHLMAKELGWIPKYQSIICAPSFTVANDCLLDYWKDYYEVITDDAAVEALRPLVRELTIDSSNYILADGSCPSIMAATSYAVHEWENRGAKVLHRVRDKELERGWEALQAFGVPRNAWFVCLHAREPGFKNEGNSEFYGFRFVDPAAYVAAVKAVTDRGGWVIRLGEPTMSEFPKMPGVIDYAHAAVKSNALDVFLYAQCRFFLASMTGAYALPTLFGKPIIFTNWAIHTLVLEGKDHLSIFKLLKSEKENRLLSFRESFESPIMYCEEVKRIYEQGWSFTNNSSEEIEEVTNEMIECVMGKAVYSEEDEELQRKFRALVPKRVGVMCGRLGKHFIRKHRALLE